MRKLFYIFPLFVSLAIAGKVNGITTTKVNGVTCTKVDGITFRVSGTTVNAVIGADNRDAQSLDNGITPDESLNNGLGSITVAGALGATMQVGFQWNPGNIPPGSAINSAIITLNVLSIAGISGTEIVRVHLIDISGGSVFDGAHTHNLIDHEGVGDASIYDWTPTVGTGLKTIDITSQFQTWIETEGGATSGQYFEVVLTTSETAVAIAFTDFSSGNSSLYGKFDFNFTPP